MSSASQEVILQCTGGELLELRGALAFLQGKLGGLEKELHVTREGDVAMRAQFATAQQDLSEATQRADQAEAAKSNLIKLIDEVGQMNTL